MFICVLWLSFICSNSTTYNYVLNTTVIKYSYSTDSTDNAYPDDYFK